MNRFLRTAYSTSLVYFVLAFIAALSTGVGMPFPAFLCLYFALLIILLPNAVPKLKGRGALLILPGVLLALLGFLAVKLYRCPSAHYIVHGLGLIAAAIFLGALRHRTTHDDFEAKFRFSVIAVLAFVAVMYLILLFGSTEELVVPIKKEYVKQAVDHGVPIAIMLLVTGVLLLRGLRGLQGTMSEKDFNRRQLRDVLVYGSLVSVVFMINPYLYRGLRWFVNSVLHPAGQGVVWAFNKLLELLANKRMDPFEVPDVDTTPAPSEYVPAPQTDMFVDKEPEHYMIDDADEGTLYRTLLYIFIAVAAAILLTILIIELVKLIEKLRERAGGRGRGYPNEIREALGDEDTGNRAEKPKKRGEPRIRIRYYYREFMRLLRREHVRIEASDTCGSINDRARKTRRGKEEELSEFRELYEKARYRAEEAPAEQDAARMKTLYEELKNR
jgi:hypothetical protein